MKKNQIALSLASVLATVSTASQAALSSEAAAAFTSLTSTVTDTLAAVWPVAILSTIGFIGLRIFKKGANKAV